MVKINLQLRDTKVEFQFVYKFLTLSKITYQNNWWLGGQKLSLKDQKHLELWKETLRTSDDEVRPLGESIEDKRDKRKGEVEFGTSVSHG